MRWYAIAVITCVSIYFLWLSIATGSRKAAGQRARKHLGISEEPQGGQLHSLLGRLSQRIDETGYLSSIRSSLEKSELDISWNRFRLFWLFAMLLVPAVSTMFTGSFLIAPAAFALAFFFPAPLLRYMVSKKARKLDEEQARFAADLALFLRCGVPVKDAIALSVDSNLVMGHQRALELFEGEVALGARPERSLLELSKRMENPDIELIAQAAVTSMETGADIRSVMDAVGEALRERAAIKRELDSQTIQGKLSGRIVAGLPLIFLGLSALVSRSTLEVLIGTAPGLIMLIVALLLDLLGFLWIRKILHIEI